MADTRRDIEAPFTCKRSGDCCRHTTEVRVTHAERQAIESAAPTSAVLAWRPDADPRFVRLTAGPCPLLTSDGCSVYDVRPLSCRQFMCGRPDVVRETYDVDFITGCGNLTARLEESHRFREHYATHARKTLKVWGKAMGY